ncbi:MAG: thymidine kinase [Bacteroidia bacterium]|nr:thymidine kinase [Bacteroidia bacterium]NNC85331.1 thymidine kinase [Bacteroidia bacterium]NNM16369.1 thymidine kinase [Bacteroidia bacterium]
MFLEQPKHKKPLKGWIEVVCGSMFSGKTEELIRRLKRARIARQNVMIFKPQTDKRYDETKVVSHDDNRIPSTPVANAKEILNLVKEVDVIGIDEAQFFGQDLIEVSEKLANNGVRVIIAGLDLDFLGKPFGPMPNLLAVAEYITKVHAICISCGDLAHNSYRTVEDEKLIVLGEKESYLPLCRDCFNRETNPEKK